MLWSFLPNNNFRIKFMLPTILIYFMQIHVNYANFIDSSAKNNFIYNKNNHFSSVNVVFIFLFIDKSFKCNSKYFICIFLFIY